MWCRLFHHFTYSETEIYDMGKDCYQIWMRQISGKCYPWTETITFATLIRLLNNSTDSPPSGFPPRLFLITNRALCLKENLHSKSYRSAALHSRFPLERCHCQRNNGWKREATCYFSRDERAGEFGMYVPTLVRVKPFKLFKTYPLYLPF